MDWEVVHVRRSSLWCRRPYESGQVMHSACNLASFGWMEVSFRTVLHPKGFEGSGVVTKGAGEKGSVIDIELP